MKLAEELQYVHKQHGNQVAFSYLEEGVMRQKTYAEFCIDIVGVKESLEQMPEKNIAIIGNTSYWWICNLYAGLLSGKQTAIIDPLLPDDEMQAVLENTETQLLCVEEELLLFAKTIQEKLGSGRVIEIQKNNSLKVEIELPSKPEGNIICMTSGTSGNTKGVIITTKAWCNNSLNLAKVMEGKKGEKVYTPLPLHHLYGVVKTLSFIHMGLEICLGTMRSVASDLEVYSPDLLLVVPSVVEFVHKRDCIPKTVKTVIVSGCKCEKRIQEILDEKDIFLQNIYGSSETAGGIALNVKGDDIDELTMIPGIEVCIAEDDEIVLRPSGHMEGYYKNQEATDEIIIDGWLHTGDLGYLDEKGRLHIKGRKKDIIAMNNGDKIYCAETDEILNGMAGVEEAAVIYAKEQLIAVIIPKKGVTEEAIRAELARYNKGQQYIRKIPEIWFYKEALPRTSSGKMKRNELTEEYIAIHVGEKNEN